MLYGTISDISPKYWSKIEFSYLQLMFQISTHQNLQKF